MALTLCLLPILDPATNQLAFVVEQIVIFAHCGCEESRRDVIANGEIKPLENGNIDIAKGDYLASIAINKEGNWVLTAFDASRSPKEKRINANTSIMHQGIAKAEDGTHLLPRIDSENKDTTTIPENQIPDEKFFGNAPISEDIPFMIKFETFIYNRYHLLAIEVDGSHLVVA